MHLPHLTIHLHLLSQSKITLVSPAYLITVRVPPSSFTVTSLRHYEAEASPSLCSPEVDCHSVILHQVIASPLRPLFCQASPSSVSISFSLLWFEFPLHTMSSIPPSVGRHIYQSSSPKSSQPSHA